MTVVQLGSVQFGVGSLQHFVVNFYNKQIPGLIKYHCAPVQHHPPVIYCYQLYFTMTGRGKGGKGLGKGGAKRHRKVLRDNIQVNNSRL